MKNFPTVIICVLFGIFFGGFNFGTFVANDTAKRQVVNNQATIDSLTDQKVRLMTIIELLNDHHKECVNEDSN